MKKLINKIKIYYLKKELVKMGRCTTQLDDTESLIKSENYRKLFPKEYVEKNLEKVREFRGLIGFKTETINAKIKHLEN